MPSTASSLTRRLAVVGLATGLALAVAASFPAHASAKAKLGCPVQKRAARIVSLQVFKSHIRPTQAAYFRTHKLARARHAFARGQQRRLAALKRAVTVCGKAGANAVPETVLDPATAPCSPSLYSAPYTEMNEGTTNATLPLRPTGPIRAAMLFVDFPDLQSNDSTTALYDRFVPQARSWYNEVSYGRAQLDVTPLNRWVRMPRSLASYGLRDGISWPEHHDYMADAIAAADPSFDFSAYQVVYVVAPRGTGVDRSPAFQAYPGSGIRVDGTEIRYGATYFDDTRSDARYAANVFIHETGHILGLPDLYDFSHSGSWSADLFRFAGSWDTMSWNEQGGHFLAWEKWKLGWLDPSQLTCLGGPGELTTTVTLLERTGGLKAIVVPTGLSSAYVIEARKRIGEDARLCEDGVLIYTVNAAIRSGSGPIQVQAAQRDNTSGDAFSRCGPLYNAPFDSAKGEVATFTDNAAGLTVQVLSSSATGYRVHVTRTSYAPQGGPAQVAQGSQSVQSQETNFAPPQGAFSTISLPFGLGWDLAPLEAG